MIAGINGRIRNVDKDSVVIENGGVHYQVLIPAALMRDIEQMDNGEELYLVTYQYFQMSQSSAVPVLIGFLNDIQKEFFEKFISVSGIGPRAACRALAENFARIAAAIDGGNESVLRSLPGIGGRKAGEIIAKLKGRVGKYCLMRENEYCSDTEPGGFTLHEDIKSEAVEILKQLQYRPQEAERMVEEAFGRLPGAQTSEDILNEVYKQRKTN